MTDTLKPGDQVFVAYLSWGRDPTLQRVTVKQIGPKVVVTQNHGRFNRASTTFYATRLEALVAMRDLYQKKLHAARLEAQQWETQIDTVDAEIEALKRGDAHG